MDARALWQRVRPPLWARWTVALLVGVAAFVALILFVSHNNSNSLAHESPRHVAQEEQEDRVVVGQDQVPRTVLARPGDPVRATLVRAVTSDMRGRIASGNVNGPLQRVRCHTAGRAGANTAYSCTAVAADVNYPFVGVARHARITFCKRDLPPIPSEDIPVSSRCRLAS